MVSIRPATPADTDAMVRIQTDALRRRAAESYADAQLAALLPDGDVPDQEFESTATNPVVAEIDGEIVGWGSLHLENDHSRGDAADDPQPVRAVLAATFVDPDHAERGVGTALVERLLSVARDAGCETVVVHASRNAVGFYEAVGFERIERIDVSGPDHEDLELPGVVMRTVLSSSRT
ncbi:GNAT family N-acetyltransferase [Halobiforma nitratireducens]|uniref:N-acetyltransferase GCN5 n=1 Tax=Halobiforma nitratireducens JCM 10879 TaxID=1227454 RepID=M0L4H1_9EURY|nr:GNAT family N-acetyltransferase [Halobiforma nitratireducens]EMA27334.1 N-acetyltransferase GCN5 [Halobiforma nitratireducens JCM 10879]